MPAESEKSRDCYDVEFRVILSPESFAEILNQKLAAEVAEAGYIFEE